MLIEPKDFVPTKVAFTGQPEDDTEHVLCAACMKSATSLRFTGWFDPYVGGEYPKGAYVHYSCLSAERLHEISLLDAKDKEEADQRRLAAKNTATR